ncbi:hypothetical protein GCM10022380_70140 [Amycolatopsis tucumanensis]|uniref:Uncharacterized protein n=1 Tax=Amycolatopsis tucumanensis TaxID=401106 RepID=A0ABP7JDC5_9PSEU
MNPNPSGPKTPDTVVPSKVTSRAPVSSSVPLMVAATSAGSADVVSQGNTGATSSATVPSRVWNTSAGSTASTTDGSAAAVPDSGAVISRVASAGHPVDATFLASPRMAGGTRVRSAWTSASATSACHIGCTGT